MFCLIFLLFGVKLLNKILSSVVLLILLGFIRLIWLLCIISVEKFLVIILFLNVWFMFFVLKISLFECLVVLMLKFVLLICFICCLCFLCNFFNVWMCFLLCVLWVFIFWWIYVFFLVKCLLNSVFCVFFIFKLCVFCLRYVV